jgi:hypothetical protein
MTYVRLGHRLLLLPAEGPFADPTQRLPRHPRAAAERAPARKRSGVRQRAGEDARDVSAVP